MTRPTHYKKREVVWTLRVVNMAYSLRKVAPQDWVLTHKAEVEGHFSSPQAARRYLEEALEERVDMEKRIP